MRAFAAAALLVCLAYGQDAVELTRAREEAARVRGLVEAGVIPPAQLKAAERVLADAEDMAVLRRTLYGGEIAEEQVAEMLTAAERRLERRKQGVEDARKLIGEGVASQLSLGPFLEELDRSRKEYDLAVSRARLTHEIAEMARSEEAAEPSLEPGISVPLFGPLAEKFEGSAPFSLADLSRIALEFELKFARPLPVSARGETAVHRALGFDHRNRADIALHPDVPEGVWLRQYLTANKIPYFAFRRAIPGKATAAHIHIGPASGRIQRGGD